MERAIAKIGYELKAVLDQEVSLMEDLLDVMQKEHQMLLSSSTSQIYVLNKSKELLILQHSYLDRNRRQLTSRLAKKLGLENSEPTLSKLVQIMEGKLSGLLSKLHEELSDLVNAIQQLGMENSELIECSIKVVQDSWSMLKRQFINSSKQLNVNQPGTKSASLIPARI